MTPAINFLTKHNIPFTVHEYELTKEPENYGQEVANMLGVGHDRLFKTLLVAMNGQAKDLAVCIVPVANTLNLKLAAKALKVKKVEMADPSIAEKTTGYVVGGISPFGQKKRLKVVVDSRVLAHKTIYASAGRRGLQIEVAPSSLVSSLSATVTDLTL